MPISGVAGRGGYQTHPDEVNSSWPAEKEKEKERVHLVRSTLRTVPAKGARYLLTVFFGYSVSALDSKGRST